MVQRAARTAMSFPEAYVCPERLHHAKVPLNIQIRHLIDIEAASQRWKRKVKKIRDE